MVAASKACLQAPPPFLPSQFNVWPTSLAGIFLLAVSTRFLPFSFTADPAPRQCNSFSEFTGKSISDQEYIKCTMKFSSSLLLLLLLLFFEIVGILLTSSSGRYLLCRRQVVLPTVWIYIIGTTNGMVA